MVEISENQRCFGGYLKMGVNYHSRSAAPYHYLCPDTQLFAYLFLVSLLKCTFPLWFWVQLSLHVPHENHLLLYHLVRKYTDTIYLHIFNIMLSKQQAVIFRMPRRANQGMCLVPENHTSKNG